MRHYTILLDTRDGRCPANTFHRGGNGPWPGVLLYMDGVGIRPALFGMAPRM